MLGSAHKGLLRLGLAVNLVLLGLIAGSLPAPAAEDSKQFYLLGAKSSMAGFIPPPGTYFSVQKYIYSGDASGAAANGQALRQIGNVSVQADISMDVDFFFEIPTLLWVTPHKIFGGQFGVGGLVPIGWQEASVNVNPNVTLTINPPINGPFNGLTLQRGTRLSFDDDTVNIGDPILSSFLGWQRGNWYWNVTTLLNIPIGAYDKNDLTNMGLHRWALDASFAATWFDPAKGREASATVGYTLNGENSDTNYESGDEFHAEFALMQHFSKAFAAGLTGFHYQQTTGDSGAGAILGSFKGRTSALGPNINFNFKLGQAPVSTSLRWMHEFDVKNRAKGDIVVFSATLPLGGPRN